MFRRPWYGEPNAVSNAIGRAKFRSPLRSCCDPGIRWHSQRDRSTRAQGRFQRAH